MFGYKLKKNLHILGISRTSTLIYSIFCRFIHSPPSVVKITLPDTYFNGSLVLSHKVNLKFFNNKTSANFDCIMPNRTPGHIRGPSPKGMKLTGFLFAISSNSNLSGLYSSGFTINKGGMRILN